MTLPVSALRLDLAQRCFPSWRRRRPGYCSPASPTRPRIPIYLAAASRRTDSDWCRERRHPGPQPADVRAPVRRLAAADWIVLVLSRAGIGGPAEDRARSWHAGRVRADNVPALRDDGWH